MDRATEIKDIITGIQHIGIPTNSIDDTIGFYQKLGFQIMHKAKIPDSNKTVVFLCLQNVVIETYECEEVKLCQGAIAHIALNVRNAEAARNAIVQLGLKPVEERIQYLPFWEHGFRYFNILGPNCETIEFGQIL